MQYYSSPPLLRPLLLQWKSGIKIEVTSPGADPGGETPPKIGKNRIFWRKIVIFHTKYPKNVCASLHSGQFV